MNFRTALLSCCVLILVGIDAVADGVKLPERGLCAHRGAQSTHPENTIPAFREAIRLGAHQIEFDVALTADGHMVVIHDKTVDRTTDGTGKVSDLTLAEIRALDAGIFKGEQFRGVRVPTLRETLEVMPQNIWLNVHLKGGELLGSKVAAEIKRWGRLDQAFLACGYAAARAARQVCPEIMICNMHRQSNSDAYIDDTIERNCQFIQLTGKLVKPGQIKRLKDAGVKINYFGTDDPLVLRKLFELGVEFPLVDKLPEMMDTARGVGIKPAQ
jgi:glycerophosphoryl diester phosphodiesterase